MIPGSFIIISLFVVYLEASTPTIKSALSVSLSRPSIGFVLFIPDVSMYIPILSFETNWSLSYLGKSFLSIPSIAFPSIEGASGVFGSIFISLAINGLTLTPSLVITGISGLVSIFTLFRPLLVSAGSYVYSFLEFVPVTLIIP
ncbi:hypothetical protein IX293_001489 [Fusobacterium necrophorum]|nr:hypothetical protein [Fusobacterium necrophorum]